MIEIKNINKSNGDFQANKNISLKVNNGEFVGILGPNGAGKTTLINQVMGFLKPDSGSISINKYDTWLNHDSVIEKVGFIAGEIKLYENIKVKQLLNIKKKFINELDETYLKSLITYFELDLNKKIKKLSKGNKQKVAIILSLMSKPDVLILDEPTSGLDPIMQEKFVILLKKFKEKHKTVILCSHIYAEIDKLCDRVIFIKNGELIKESNMDNRLSIEKEFNLLFGDTINEEEVIFNEEV
ncbi:ABC transporter ATP-binding protein [Spiroplasma turonicum]|uniref:ABC transporter ATP-binding protein n=1 Tax=Spiroplasma turonicum TaxID=216946 RepID=A0A0K1P6Z9_9MOLU|nr:ATP-binding cassette domain-containing protein [Spiroplasma turonicum]AKU80086.1 ABC transporter ATP-binding protein [Spiroplasma turonicum]ALX71087.1 ABC transporter ATP-binding protein [Spiroplasma turonicum]